MKLASAGRILGVLVFSGVSGLGCNGCSMTDLPNYEPSEMRFIFHCKSLDSCV